MELPFLKNFFAKLAGNSSLKPVIINSSSAPFQVADDPPETIAFRAASTVRALERIASRGIEIGTVIDIGASNGMWTAAAMPILPDARYLLVEAQNGHLDSLKDFVKKHPNTEYVLAAAGDEEGEIFFDDSNLFGGSQQRTNGWGKDTCTDDYRGRRGKTAEPQRPLSCKIGHAWL